MEKRAAEAQPDIRPYIEKLTEELAIPGIWIYSYSNDELQRFGKIDVRNVNEGELLPLQDEPPVQYLSRVGTLLLNLKRSIRHAREYVSAALGVSALACTIGYIHSLSGY